MKAAAWQRWGLSLLLLSLHAVVVLGFDTPLARTLLLMHYGLFLLWQPLWHGEQALSAAAAALLTLGALLLAFSVNWWVLAFWVAGVFGLLGGRIFGAQAQRARAAYLIAAGYLLTILLTGVMPRLLGLPWQGSALAYLVQYALPLAPLSLLFFPAPPQPETEAPVLDLFYSVLLFLLTVILILGSYALHGAGESDYLQTLVRLLFGIAGALIALSWLWNPRAGFSGLGHLWSRYLLTIGMPFEHWMKKIAELAGLENSPLEFMQAAVAQVYALGWVSGGAWQSDEGRGEFGLVTPHQASFEFDDFRLTLYTRFPLTPALILHIKLLTLLLGEFYTAKRRAETLREQTYMRAVYETGSRMTHDIKNLVQSLSVLCAAAEQPGHADDERLLALLQRQLPQLNRRLQLTLDKLQTPQPESTRMIKVASWWRGFKTRQSAPNITFSSQQVPADALVDANMMDNVADNLLQNALEKSRAAGSLAIHVNLRWEEGLLLEVSDDGAAIPEALAQRLFRGHVPSENGLGIGLYHAARQARNAGYHLELSHNVAGKVSFQLICRQAQERRRYARPLPDQEAGSATL